jgi:hypothetical protein
MVGGPGAAGLLRLLTWRAGGAQAAEAQQQGAKLAEAQAEKARLVSAFSEERQRWESDELARRGQLEERQAAMVGSLCHPRLALGAEVASGVACSQSRAGCAAHQWGRLARLRRRWLQAQEVQRLRAEADARAEQGATQETVLRHTQLRNQQLAEQLQQVGLSGQPAHVPCSPSTPTPPASQPSIGPISLGP